MTPKQRFLQYEGHPKLEVFGMQESFHVSQNPFITRILVDCTSVPIVINAKGELWGGATHNNYKTHADVYMPRYKNRILELTRLTLTELQSNSVANAVAGMWGDHNLNLQYLDKFRIPLAPYSRFDEIQGFIDFMFQGNIPAGEKQVLVIPELQEVIMYSKPVGYIQLI